MRPCTPPGSICRPRLALMDGGLRISPRAAVAPRASDRRLNEIDLVVEPPAASVDLARVGLLVEAPLAARLVLEMLHGVGDVDFIPLDAGRFERLVEHLAGGAHEGQSGQIFLVARLLTD